MAEENLERMIKLAEEFFDVKNDPEQISVNEGVMEQLERLHPSTMNQRRDAKGPFAWVLVIPTTRKLMEEFVAGRLSEKELLARTPQGGSFEAVYLCSALVLPEHRGKGLATGMLVESIRAISKDHPIAALCSWAFSKEGDALSEKVARLTALPLFKRA